MASRPRRGLPSAAQRRSTPSPADGEREREREKERAPRRPPGDAEREERERDKAREKARAAEKEKNAIARAVDAVNEAIAKDDIRALLRGLKCALRKSESRRVHGG